MIFVGRLFSIQLLFFFKDRKYLQIFADVTWKQILETRDTYGNAPANHDEAVRRAQAAGVSNMDKVVGGTKEQYDAAGIQPTYMRFFADGHICLTLSDGRSDTSEGTMIYEYNYVGRPDSRAGV